MGSIITASEGSPVLKRRFSRFAQNDNHDTCSWSCGRPKVGPYNYASDLNCALCIVHRAFVFQLFTVHCSLFTIFYCPQHLLYFFPLPHGHGSFLPIFFSLFTIGFRGSSLEVDSGWATLFLSNLSGFCTWNK